MTFLGSVPDLAPLYAAADVLLAPTFYDPAPLATLEAMACGTPVVTTRASGHAEAAVEGGGEAVEDPWDEAVLARATGRVLALARDGGLVPRCRAAAERHSWKRHLDRLEAIYREAAAAKTRGPSGATRS